MLYSSVMKRVPALLAFASLLTLSGCLIGTSQEELERLMKEDASFKQMIASRDQTHGQIRAIREDLLSRKKAADAQISRLRADYDAYAKTQSKRIEQLQQAIEANRTVLQQQIGAAEAQLESKRVEAEGYEKTLADVKRMLRDAKGIRLSTAERQKWEERMLMLSEKIRPLREEIQELKLQVRLKRQKIAYLK